MICIHIDLNLWKVMKYLQLVARALDPLVQIILQQRSCIMVSEISTCVLQRTKWLWNFKIDSWQEDYAYN